MYFTSIIDLKEYPFILRPTTNNNAFLSIGLDSTDSVYWVLCTWDEEQTVSSRLNLRVKKIFLQNIIYK